MSLKGVELQIAIPKTFDAGKAVDHQNQNVVQQQLHANEELKKELERKQMMVNDTDKMDAVSDEDDQQSNDHQQQSDGNKKNQQEKNKSAKHPFKGNFIDYSG